MEKSVKDLIPTVFVLQDEFADVYNPCKVEFHRMNSPFYDGEKWAVRRGRVCLDKDGEWVIEPSPSNRDEEFYAECRFASLEEAFAVYSKRDG